MPIDESRAALAWSKIRFSIGQLLVFQLRIGLVILFVAPFILDIIKHQDRLVPSTYVWIAITFIVPLISIIFLVNANTLLSTLSLALFTLAGAAIGFLTSYLISSRSIPGDPLLFAVVSALLFWSGLIWYRKYKTDKKTKSK